MKCLLSFIPTMIFLNLTSLFLFLNFSCSNLNDIQDENEESQIIDVALGYSSTSINTAIFRRNSIVSHQGYQYLAFYDSTAHIVLAKRKLKSKNWIFHQTQYTGDVKDAHNIISIMIDGAGYLHVSWNHHNTVLNYAKSISSGSLELDEKESMIGTLESKVTYPEFYRFPSGDLLFIYRNGVSGNGNIVLNYYNYQQQSWERLHDNLVAGEGLRNAYWQACIDLQGNIHLSWVWREGINAATNSNIGYAVSFDAGKTWAKSNGNNYNLPITYVKTENVWKIPQKHNLINTTSMTVDEEGNPYISTYYKPNGALSTNFFVFYKKDSIWKRSQASQRTLDFSLEGIGTLGIPISRPQVLCLEKGNTKKLLLIYRDAEFDNKVLLNEGLITSDEIHWQSRIIHHEPLKFWEPTFDTELWKTNQEINLFIQKVQQNNFDQEITDPFPAKMIKVLSIQM